jgi:hypothetical protein
MAGKPDPLAPPPPPPPAGGKRAAIAAASELRRVPRPTYLAFILLAVCIQLFWGLYGVRRGQHEPPRVAAFPVVAAPCRAPRVAADRAGPRAPPPAPQNQVCTRYLQTSAREPVPSIQLSIMLMVVALAGLVCLVAIPRALRAAWRRAARRLRARAATAGPPAPPAAKGASARTDGWAAINLPPADAAPADAKSGPPPALAADGAAEAAAEAAAARRRLWVSAIVASGIGLLVALQVRADVGNSWGFGGPRRHARRRRRRCTPSRPGNARASPPPFTPPPPPTLTLSHRARR